MHPCILGAKIVNMFHLMTFMMFSLTKNGQNWSIKDMRISKNNDLNVWPSGIFISPFYRILKTQETAAEDGQNLASQGAGRAVELNVLYQNVRGLRTKPTDVFGLETSSDYHVFPLMETWLGDRHLSSNFFVRCYCVLGP